jgi:hypothetical protein
MDDRTSSEKKATETARKTAAAAGNAMSEAANRMQESASRAVDRLRDYQLKVLSATQANVNAFFEYAQDVSGQSRFRRWWSYRPLIHGGSSST